MKAVDIEFIGVYEDCHIGCPSCDFYTNTKTLYESGKATGLKVKIECSNADLCKHMMEHIKGEEC